MISVQLSLLIVMGLICGIMIATGHKQTRFVYLFAIAAIIVVLAVAADGLQSSVLGHPKKEIADGKYQVDHFQTKQKDGKGVCEFLAENEKDIGEGGIFYQLSSDAVEVREPVAAPGELPAGTLEVKTAGKFRRAIFTPNDPIKYSDED